MPTNTYLPDPAYQLLIRAIQDAFSVAMTTERTLSDILHQTFSEHNVMPESCRGDTDPQIALVA